VEFGRVHPCFSLAVWFKWERFKARSGGGYYHETRSRSVVLAENDMEAKI
jgi:hypothetical protein